MAVPPPPRSYDFDNGVDFDKLFESYKTTGFQATNLGLAIDEVKKMVRSSVRARGCACVRGAHVRNNNRGAARSPRPLLAHPPLSTPTRARSSRGA